MSIREWGPDARQVFRYWRRWRRLPEGHEKESLGLVLLETARKLVAPTYALGHWGKAWSQREGTDRRAERKFFLRQLAAGVQDVSGETAEMGVYEGTTSAIICETLGRRHHAFDSFEGLSEPGGVDGDFWSAGDLRLSEHQARSVLEPFDAGVYKGWIPDVFEGVKLHDLCFAHVDVDLYEPTRDSLAFVYPRLVEGAVFVCDDYGFTTCPGARPAVDEFMEDKPERVVEVPTGQAFFIKQ